MTRTAPAFLFLLLFLFGSTDVLAQSLEERQSRYRQASMYRYAEPGDVTIEVNVWGAVSNPGRYVVPRDTRVNDLFSFAGGPLTGEQTWTRERTLTVRLSREQNDHRVIVFETEMQDQILALEQNPPLQEGDILMVESYTREAFTWRDVFTVASGLSTTFLVIERFISLAL